MMKFHETIFKVITVFFSIIIFACGKSNEEPKQAISNVSLIENSVVEPRISSNQSSIHDDITNSRSNSITRAISKLTPCVVGINVTQIREYVTRNPFSDWFFEPYFPERRRQKKVKSIGSGFILSSDGYIVTNDHVVDNAVRAEVFLANGEKYEAEIIGSDYISDIALLKINGNNLPYCELGDSDEIIIGEWAIALGNPFGLFELGQQPTATVGVISAKNMNFGRQEDDRVYQGMVQTDAAINPGNSGGAMANALGQVIGVNTFIYTGNQQTQGSIGLGFAIPINKVKEVVEELKRFGKIDRQFITGLEVENLRLSVARYFGLKTTKGVIVSNVERNSPASDAGFNVGDIITEFGGEKINSTKDIWKVLDNKDARAGDLIEVIILRKTRLYKLQLKLGKVS